MPTISIDRSYLSEKEARTGVQSYLIIYVFTKPIICNFHWILLDTRLRITCMYTRVAQELHEFHVCTRYLVGELYCNYMYATRANLELKQYNLLAKPGYR